MGKPSAHAEHTIAITEEGPEVLTLVVLRQTVGVGSSYAVIEAVTSTACRGLAKVRCACYYSQFVGSVKIPL